MNSGARLPAKVAGLLMLLPTLALAQAGRLPPPNGVKVGEGRLHPYIELENRFDSAAFFGPDSPGGPHRLRPELVTHVRPGFRLDVPSPAVALGLNGHLDYLWYTGLVTPGSQLLSQLHGQGALDLGFNPGRSVEVRLGDRFVRTDRADNPALGVGVISLYNQAKAELALRPGGGALELVPGASYTVEFFTPLSPGALPGCPDSNPLCSSRSVSLLNYGNLGLHLNGSYKFLPKTALVLDANYDMRSYSGSSRPAMLLHATLGLAGLLSPKVAVVAKAGWGQDFGTSIVQTMVGQLEASWLISQTANLKVGYLRRVQPIALLGSYLDNRGYVEGRALLGGQLTLRAYASVDHLGFWEAARSDWMGRVDLGPEYAIRRWMILGGGYLLTTRASSASGSQSFNFARHEGYLRATLTY